ncbi:MAG: type II toxin-antitoxin system PemK/MazF family toxin [Planctomycetaceae bacterium]
MNRGDVVLIEFPYSDRTGGKLRPALVIQADVWNQTRDDTILAAISRTQRFASTEVIIDITTPEGQPSGLRHTSVVDCANISTFDQRLIHHTLGSLAGNLLQHVDGCLKRAIGLP